MPRAKRRRVKGHGTVYRKGRTWSVSWIGNGVSPLFAGLSHEGPRRGSPCEQRGGRPGRVYVWVAADLPRQNRWVISLAEPLSDSGAVPMRLGSKNHEHIHLWIQTRRRDN
jgi:hypothetical protein